MDRALGLRPGYPGYPGERQGGARVIRRVLALGLVTLVTVLVGLWLFGAPERLAARFTAEACRQVALTDDRTGQPIRGAEALVLDPDGGRVILAAHDRGSMASGGLYAVTVFALASGAPSVTARTLYGGPGDGAVFRPHGLALSPDGVRLATINRTAPGVAQVEIGPLDGDRWQPDRVVTGGDLCRANGLSFTGQPDDDMVVTLDRADCGFALRDVLPGAQTGRLGRFDGEGFPVVVDGLSFPNGVAVPYVAETRAARIRRPEGPSIELPGGPDNLWIAPDGRLITAVHPRPHLLWLYLQGVRSTAPTRVLAVDVAEGSYEVLFDDPKGRVFSGATGAVLAGGLLIAGSVADRGLLVCGGGAL